MGPQENDVFAERYKITEKIGQDQFGTRFFAEDSETGANVQVKTLPPQMHTDDEARSRFLREIQLLSSIRHPGIVSVLESGEIDGLFYLIAEHEEGIDLENYLAAQGKLPEKDAVNLIIPVIECLKHVWEDQQIVHRDIKPEKIFITDDNKVKILDLGLAKSLSNDTMELTGAGFAIGTPDYMSPEQAGGEDLDYRSDMYSLGLVLYQMVTAQKAFSGPVMEVMNKQMTEMPPSPSEVGGVSERCSNIIEKMIQKSPDDRFGSWDECIEAMHLLLDSTIMESDLQFDVKDFEVDQADDFEPSFENLTGDDDGAFGAPKVNASGIILEEEEAVEESAMGLDTPAPPREVDVIEPGSIIGNGYEIDRQVGSGSMGDIYLAFSEESDKLVQVKILPAHMTDDQEKVERFLQEIKITASLQHGNLLCVLEAGEDNGRYYLVTEYEEGISYHDYIGRYGPLPEKDALRFLAQIADVLKYAWAEKKLLHREIKPENILIKEGSKEAKLTDFGVAKTLEGDSLNLTGMGFTIGTPDYMSPEQVRGEEDLDFRSDMYAIGLVLYESLTKQKVFQSDNVMQLMTMQMNDPHKPIRSVNGEVSKYCAELIDRLLCKEKEGRFESWDDLLRAMHRVLEDKQIQPLHESAPVVEDSAPKADTKIDLDEKEEASASHAPSAPTAASRAPEEPKKGGSGFIIAAIVVIVVIIVVLLIK